METVEHLRRYNLDSEQWSRLLGEKPSAVRKQVDKLAFMTTPPCSRSAGSRTWLDPTARVSSR
jgi:hypothetical protein